MTAPSQDGKEVRHKTAEEKLARIEQIDLMFKSAEGWGSWMASASGERKGLVNSLKQYDGVDVPHNWEIK